MATPHELPTPLLAPATSHPPAPAEPGNAPVAGAVAGGGAHQESAAAAPLHPRAATRSEHPEVDATLKALGRRLRLARQARDLKLAQLAQRIDCSANTLTRMESGAPGVSIETVLLVLWHLGLLTQVDGLCAPGTDVEGEQLAILRQPRRARGQRIAQPAGDEWLGLHGL